ncbi:hypothetical protein EG850_11195 [Gulosibacter macacae]|uniref:Uncharacterized protein n=1 Tax=Gulosibacter macacae TaxID=2488791 RepID=A0A3P3VU15_9MICO|nr:hypothetical protein [Gulosibacter macacae]RRJ85944.1 hypothetical protein EG850_11195 [Gulosibacter macacae]
MEWMKKLSILQWAWISTACTFLFGWLPPVGALFLIAAITLWIIYARRRSQPKREAKRAALLAEQAYRANLASAIPEHGPGKPLIVRVAYRDVNELMPDGTDPDTGYSFYWRLREPALVGQRVIVDGFEGPSPAVVIGYGRGAGAVGLRLKDVTSIIQGAPLAVLEPSHHDEMVARVIDARTLLGMPPHPTLQRRHDIAGSVFPPVDGPADPHSADLYGRKWWGVYKNAEQLNLDQGELAEIKAIANYWFAIRDGKATPPHTLNSPPGRPAFRPTNESSGSKTGEHSRDTVDPETT